MPHVASMADARRAERLFKEIEPELQALTPAARAKLVSFVHDQAPAVADVLREIMADHGLPVAA